jgi:putative nucleotidyltransferase with HDIG domain
MVAAEDVATPEGRVLLRREGVVEPWHIQLFAGLKIPSIEVAEAGDQARQLAEAAAYALDFFAYVNPDSRPMTELYAYVAELVANRLAQGWQLPSLSERQAENVEHLADVFPMEIVEPKRIVAHESEVASFPDIYLKLRAEVDSPKASVQSLSALVCQDISLSAKLLKLVNSPMYGYSDPVDSIERAISLVGIRELSILAMGITAINYFQGIPPELIDMRTFWRHSISCGILAKILAQSLGEKQVERFFIAGLLHDVGRLVLFKKMPYASTEALIYARNNFVPIVEAERVTFEFTHTDVSAHLLTQWNFPQHLAELINFHHDPLAAPSPRLAAVVHVADVFANAVQIAGGGLYLMPPFYDAAWELLGFPEDMVKRTMAEFEIQGEQIVQALF